jgi:ABC-type transport system substrate-binding protein
MRKRSVLLLAGALAITASLVIGPAASAKSERTAAGTVVFIHEQEPAILNTFIEEGSLAATAIVSNPILANGMIYNDKAVLTPVLFDGKPQVVKSNPLTIKFKYKQSAKWSDGSPVTGNDFLWTYKTIMNPNWDITSRDGFDQIKSVKAVGKNVTVVFKKPSALWDVTVATQLIPAKAVSAGQNFNELWRDSIALSSGPFKFGGWQKGTQITLLKNNAYAAGPKAKLDRVVVKFILDTNARFQALKAGEGQAMEPQPQLAIAAFYTDSKFKVLQGTQFAYEHMDISQSPKGHPALKQLYVRQAITTGINRPQIAKALYSWSKQPVKPLQSLVFQPIVPQYQNNWASVKFSQKKVIQILKSHGCTGGPDTPSAGNDNIFSCPNVGKLSFAFSTTTGNVLRALTFEIIQKQLQSVGIEFKARFQPAGTLFGTTLPDGDFDIAMYTFVGSPATDINQFNTYGCGGGQNYIAYCNQKATAIFKAANVTIDETKRNKMLNDAEVKYMVKDIPSFPLYARPLFYIHANSVKGMVLNPTQQEVTWNAQAWSLVS